MDNQKWFSVGTVITLCLLFALAGEVPYRVVGFAVLASGLYSMFHVVAAYRRDKQGVDLNATPLPLSTHVPHGVSGRKKRE